MNLKDVIRLVGWYKQRWHIEQLFRIMKNQGFRIEDSQLENYSSLSKMCTLVLLSAIEVLKLTISREGKNKRTFDDEFETYDKDLFLKINSKCEGKTKKQQNPHRKFSLAWVSWIIGRLGGWNGYSSERPPGPITMFNGLKKYYSLKSGWGLALE